MHWLSHELSSCSLGECSSLLPHASGRDSRQPDRSGSAEILELAAMLRSLIKFPEVVHSRNQVVAHCSPAPTVSWYCFPLRGL